MFDARLEEKRRQIEAWLDEPHRSLDGMTPRQAATHRRRWRKLEVILKVKEHGERELPAELRYDFDELRRQLKLPSP